MRRLFLSLLVVCTLAVSACKESGTVRVTSLTFTGVKAVDEARLRAALATRVSSKIPWGRKAFFDRSRFDADLKRLEAFYADRGFPDARVTGFDVKLNDQQDAVALTVTIDEGAPVTVMAVNFAAFDPVPPDRMKSLQTSLPLVVGTPRDRQQVVAAHEAAVNVLREHGYPYAKVGTEENDGPDGKQAAITFTAEPGPLAYFGEVEIAGNTSVSDRIIERQLTYRAGDLYRRSVVQSSQRRLYGMELFQFVNVETLNPENQESEVRTRVTVAEGKHQRLNFGVGYGTEEKARGNVEYRHLNFLGGARTAGARARWSSLDRGVRADFNQPYFFDPQISLGADAQQWWTYVPAYSSVVTGGKVTLTRRPTPQTSWAVSMSSERTSSSVSDKARLPNGEIDPTIYADLIAIGLDPVTGKQEGVSNALGFDYQRSTADNLLNARRGYQIAFHVEEAGRLLPGTFNYYAASTDVRHYLPIRRSLTWANRAQIGAIWPTANRPGNVPFNKKFFLGGATSVRGWGRFEVGPLGGQGLPIGGNSLFAFSSEIRTALTGSLGGVVFVDAGNVWSGVDDLGFDDLRYATGVGLRYQTPVGPVRFDFGYQLNPIPGLRPNGEEEKRRWRIHFSIGQAF